ncbi:MAG: DUF222 domain-containing protein, partial [Algicola sp.]|nr:DUF222 domain-containing protein [Algicola sp.]
MGHSESCIFEDSNNLYKYDTDVELASGLTMLSSHINAAQYRFLKMLAEFDRRQAWTQHGMRSCTQWLNWKCSMCGSTAREKLRVAHCLEDLPKINKAFEAGEISYSKVRAITRVGTDDNEEILLEVARGGTANQLDKLVRKYQRVDENQNPIEAVDEYEQRRVDFRQAADGTWVIHAKLPQVEGGLLKKALDEIVRQHDIDKNDSAEAPKEG